MKIYKRLLIILVILEILALCIFNKYSMHFYGISDNDIISVLLTLIVILLIGRYVLNIIKMKQKICIKVFKIVVLCLILIMFAGFEMIVKMTFYQNGVSETFYELKPEGDICDSVIYAREGQGLLYKTHINFYIKINSFLYKKIDTNIRIDKNYCPIAEDTYRAIYDADTKILTFHYLYQKGAHEYRSFEIPLH